jgi:hypothetical protein
MPTTKPRLYMTLAPRTDRVLRTLAKLQAVPISQVAATLLDASVPALEEVVAAMNDVQHKVAGADKRVHKVVRGMLSDTRDLVTDLEHEMDGPAALSRSERSERGMRRPSRPTSKRHRTPGL